MPDPVAGRLATLAAWVDKFLVDNLEPLEPSSIKSFDEWLEACDYTQARKAELRLAKEELGEEIPSGAMLHCKSFMKKESYFERYKYPRAINSRTDYFKVYSGPWFSSIEDRVYRHPAFIKHVPVRLRPQYIYDKLHSWGCWYITDYTSFESSFTPALMEACELRLYRYMLQRFPEVSSSICDAISGENLCKFRDVQVKVEGCRMSGDMCTSLGNGFTNFMVMSCIVNSLGGNCMGVVEGDDGEFGTSVEVTREDFRAYGFDIKIERIDDLFRGSFCGLVLTRELTSMVDPRKVLSCFGISLSPHALGSPKVRLELLRAKALSLIYEHPRCPIVTALGRRYELLTRGLRARFEADWWRSGLVRQIFEFREDTERQVALGISDQIRADFAEQFGIEPHIQIAIESYLDCHGVEPLDHQLIQALFPPFAASRDYYSRFVSSQWRDYDWVYAVEPYVDRAAPVP